MVEFVDDFVALVKILFDFIIDLSYAAIILPFKIAYIEEGEYPEWDNFDYFVDAMFILDIIVNFFSAYYDSENNLILDNKKIALKYLKGWFIIDFIVN